jgi:hypothetical protein
MVIAFIASAGVWRSALAIHTFTVTYRVTFRTTFNIAFTAGSDIMPVLIAL